MLAKPNTTVVEGKVGAIRPHADGWGADVDLEVLRNVSPNKASDFLSPEPGRTMTVFTAEPQQLHVGDRVRARLSLLAGPGGGRTVVEAVEPLSP